MMRSIWQGASIRTLTAFSHPQHQESWKIQTRRIRKYSFGAPARSSRPIERPAVGCLAFASGLTFCANRFYNSYCDSDDETASSSATNGNTTSVKSAIIDAYLLSLMEDHRLIKLPYNMGTSNATLMHLFGVDRAIVEEAIATVESTIDGWNKEAGTIVGHPIVYVLKDPDDTSTIGETGDDNKPTTTTPEERTVVISHRLVHYPDFYVDWSLLELVADILWEDPRVRLGIFPESFEKTFMINILNVVSAILFDMLLSLSITMNNGAVQLRWSVDKEKYRQYFEDLSKDPETFRNMVKESLNRIDFDEISRQAKEAVQQQQRQQEQVQQQGQEDVLQALYQFAQEKSLPHTSLDHVEVEIYEMTFKLVLILFYWFTLDTEARILGRSVTQHFVKPSDAASCAIRDNVLKDNS